MAGILAPVDENGNLITNTHSGDSLKKGKDKNAVDSDMFLTLLVAEMQNQDPLEPTSNTEWVSQYATFTQVQQMSEMAQSVDVLRANNLIGKEVIMKTTSQSTGDVSYTQGTVDYVEMEEGKPLLVINGNKFSISDLDTIVSPEYSKAYEMYDTLKGMINGLPSIKFADKSYENVIQGALDYYNTMDEYQKHYMEIYGSEEMNTLAEWKHALEVLGVKFKDNTTTDDKKASLDDILESFNTKMNAILDKLNLLTENKTPSTEDTDQDKEDEGGKTEDGDGKTENA